MQVKVCGNLLYGHRKRIHLPSTREFPSCTRVYSSFKRHRDHVPFRCPLPSALLASAICGTSHWVFTSHSLAAQPTAGTALTSRPFVKGSNRARAMDRGRARLCPHRTQHLGGTQHLPVRPASRATSSLGCLGFTFPSFLSCILAAFSFCTQTSFPTALRPSAWPSFVSLLRSFPSPSFK